MFPSLRFIFIRRWEISKDSMCALSSASNYKKMASETCTVLKLAFGKVRTQTFYWFSKWDNIS
jgi:hypothetical protein